MSSFTWALIQAHRSRSLSQLVNGLVDTLREPNSRWRLPPAIALVSRRARGVFSRVQSLALASRFMAKVFSPRSSKLVPTLVFPWRPIRAPFSRSRVIFRCALQVREPSQTLFPHQSHSNLVAG